MNARGEKIKVSARIEIEENGDKKLATYPRINQETLIKFLDEVTKNPTRFTPPLTRNIFEGPAVIPQEADRWI